MGEPGRDARGLISALRLNSRAHCKVWIFRHSCCRGPQQISGLQIIKFILAAFTAVLVVLLIDNVVNELSHKKPLERNAYAVLASGELEPAKPEPESSAVAAPAVESILALLASADPAASQKATKLCTTCHTFNEGGKNRVGPNLWGMVGKEKDTVDGFKYSDALGNGGGVWSYEDLDAFLADPKGFLKGTRMSFSGIKSVKKRAAIIAYMRQQSSNPSPLPSQYR